MIPDKLDSANVEVQGLPPTLYMWRIKNQLGDRTMIPADTTYHHFQNTNLTEGITGHYNYLANLGSPRLSRIFFERRYPEPTIFMEPFSSFFIRPTEFNFTNSNVPYTNLTYHKAGNKQNGEERFKSYFSVNVNKKLSALILIICMAEATIIIKTLLILMPRFSVVTLATAIRCRESIATTI